MMMARHTPWSVQGEHEPNGGVESDSHRVESECAQRILPLPTVKVYVGVASQVSFRSLTDAAKDQSEPSTLILGLLGSCLQPLAGPPFG